MRWIKKGMLYKVNNSNEYLLSHASNPLAVHLSKDVYRIFYSGRNKENKSSVSFVDIDILSQEIIYDSKKPVVLFGDKNSFYSHGISIGNLYSNNNNENFILFMGWQIPENEHWRGDIGRLQVFDNLKMEVNPKDAFLSIDIEDKVSLSYPFVIFHEGIYKMWYGSTINWTSSNGEMIHVIKYATSSDGVQWKKQGIAIPYKLGLAQAFSRPSVIIDHKGYHMWYSFRSGSGEKYRIGYSFSRDGINWKNYLDKAGITVSENGWDSEMICYPFVFNHNGENYMLYNGNDYGKNGFGIAILKK